MEKTIGCIGVGVMGSALMEAVLKTTKATLVFVSDPDQKKCDEFCARTGCSKKKSNTELAKAVDILFLAVKPQYLDGVLAEIAGVLHKETLVISMAAGVSLERIKKGLQGHEKLIRIMPNTPVAVGSGLIALAVDKENSRISSEELYFIKELLAPAGLVEQSSENLMDAVTAVSGSGPAYAYLFIDALADAGVRMGLPRDQALRYAAQTLKGAAEMVLETKTHPGILKDSVCSPGGTTIAAVNMLEEKGFRNAIIQAALAAWNRSIELGKN